LIDWPAAKAAQPENTKRDTERFIQRLKDRQANVEVPLYLRGLSEEAIDEWAEQEGKFFRQLDPAMCEKVAEAMMQKAQELTAHGQVVVAIGILDSILTNFGEVNDPGLARVVALARNLKGAVLKSS
jgi:hypothetical protein